MRLPFLFLSLASSLMLGCGSDDNGSGPPKEPGLEYPTETLSELGGFDTGGPAPFGIVLDETHVYVSVVGGNDETGAIVRVPKTGGAPETLVPAGSSRALALGKGTLFFDNHQGSIGSVSTAGGEVHELTAQFGATALAVSGDRLVFVNAIIDATSLVGSVATEGGEVATLFETDERPTGVAVREDTAYAALLGPGNTVDSDGTIVRIPVSGGDAVPVATLLDGPRAIVAEDGILYATLEGLGRADGSVISVALPSGSVEILANRLAKPWGLTADATHLYWVNRGSGADGTIMRMAKAGGFPQTLADGQGEPRQLEVDGTHVYWTNYRSGEVMRVEKVELDAK